MEIENSQSHGFTLIELLVVIAIISLLVSIMLPSLNRAKELARRVVCSSNLKNWGVAEMMYMEQWDTYFAPTLETKAGSTDGTFWCYEQGGDFEAAPLSEFIECRDGTSKVRICPSSEQVRSYGAYTRNYHLGRFSSTTVACPRARINDISQPAEIIITTDMLYEAGALGFMGDSGSCSFQDRISDHHNGGCNILYSDTHVDWMLTSEISPEIIDFRL